MSKPSPLAPQKCRNHIFMLFFGFLGFLKPKKYFSRKKCFFHFLALEAPSPQGKNPKMTIFDLQGLFGPKIRQKMVKNTENRENTSNELVRRVKIGQGVNFLQFFSYFPLWSGPQRENGLYRAKIHRSKMENPKKSSQNTNFRGVWLYKLLVLAK